MAILCSLGLCQPTLKIDILSGNLIFLRTTKTPSTSTSHDGTTIRGTIALMLPKRKEIRSIVVSLVAEHKIIFPNGKSETGARSLGTVNIPTFTPWLEKGDHMFDFFLNVPADSAPSEKNPHGYIGYAVVSEVKFPSSSISNTKDIDLVVDPGEEGTILSLNVDSQGFNDDVGPWAILMSSHQFTVASLVNFSINLPCPPANLYLFAIRASISQRVELASINKSSADNITVPTEDIRLFNLGPLWTLPDVSSAPPAYRHSFSTGSSSAKVLAALSPNEAYTASYQFRLPNSEFLRPTTQRDTVSPFRTSHDLIVSLTFQTDMGGRDGIAHTMRVKRVINIASCCCTLDSHLVPPYSFSDPLPADSKAFCTPVSAFPRIVKRPDTCPKKSKHHGSQTQIFTCACCQTLDELVDQQMMFQPAMAMHTRGSSAPVK